MQINFMFKLKIKSIIVVSIKFIINRKIKIQYLLNKFIAFITTTII